MKTTNINFFPYWKIPLIFNKEYLNAHPDIVIDKKSDSPDEDKSLHDAKAVTPVLKDFFKKHPLINPDIFIGDAAFDSCILYKSLLQDIKFSKAYIPLNSRSKLRNEECHINENGIPCCPHDRSLLMKPEGSSKRKNGLVRYKFSCPKVKFVKQENKKYKRQCYCENPCTSSPCCRMVHIYPEKDLRAYPGTIRGTSEWEETYKIRSVVEQSIIILKKVSVLLDAKLKMRKLCMLICS